MASHYQTLRVSDKATITEIKEAYNKFFLTEELRLVQRAYDVLKDPVKRAHYDLRGQTDENLVLNNGQLHHTLRSNVYLSPG